MATRSRKAPPAISAPPAELETVADLLAQFGEKANRCRLFRWNDAKRLLEYIATAEPTPDMVERTQETYGGGEYTARLVDQSGKLVKGGTLRYSIAGAPKFPDELPAAARASAPPPAPAPAAVDAGVDRLLTLVTALVGAVTPLVVPLLTRKPSGEQSVTETLALMQAAEERGERRGEQLGALKAGGPSHPRESLADVAKAYAPLVATLVENVRMRKPVDATRPATWEGNAPAPATNAAPPAIAAPPVVQGYEWLVTLRQYYPMILQQAARGNDAAMLADFTLDQCDDDLFSLVETAARRDDFTATVTADMATIASAHPAWLAAYLARIVENCQPEETAPAPDIPKAERKRA